MTKKDKAALLPCPFCGSPAQDEMCIRDGKQVGCTKCGAGVYAFNPDANSKAIQKWNTRATLAPAVVEPVSGAVPSVFYCENGKSLDGLEQGAMAVLANLMMKTNSNSAEFMIGNDKDGKFYFTCRRDAAAPRPVASGETANTERKNASDYWARHNAPEPEKAQCTREGCTNYTGLVDGCCSFHREERREPPADLSLDAMKALKRLEDGKIYDDYDDEDIEENAKAIETIRQVLKGRISGVSKEGE